MNNKILEKHGANFFGYESIDSNGKHHYHPATVKGAGDLVLTQEAVLFKQWISLREFHIPIDKIAKLETKASHNLKMKWPTKVLRIYFEDGEETKIFGIAPGGKLSLANGWQDEALVWKEKIESLMKEKTTTGAH